MTLSPLHSHLALNSFEYLPKSGITESFGNSTFNFFEVLPYYFPLWLNHFVLSTTVHMGSDFVTYSPTPIIYFHNSHLNGMK